MKAERKDEKALAIAILGRLKPKGGEAKASYDDSDESDDADDTEDMGAESAAEEFLEAIEAKDAKALLAAWRSLKEMC